MTYGRSYDAIVAGTRLAGCAAAMLLARQGLRVLVIEKTRHQISPALPVGLLPGTVRSLRRWGLFEPILGAGTQAITRTTHVHGNLAIDMPLTGRGRAVYAPSRQLLETFLVQAARQAGVAFSYETAVRGVLLDKRGAVSGLRVSRGGGPEDDVTADLVIATDRQRPDAPRWTDCLYQYVRGASPRGLRWHHGKGVWGGLIPSSEGLICAVMAGPGVRDGGAGPLHDLGATQLPSMAAELRGGIAVGAGAARGMLPAGRLHGWAMAGGPGCALGPLAGQDILRGFRDAQALCDAISGGALDSVALGPEARSLKLLRRGGEALRVGR